MIKLNKHINIKPVLFLIVISFITFSCKTTQKNTGNTKEDAGQVTKDNSEIFIEANKEYIDIANELKRFSTPETRIAVVTAGAIPYFSELPAIDLLGKNDPVIAQQLNHLPNKIADIRPGHMKWDYDYTIGELKPNVIVQIWGDTETVEGYQDLYYVVIDTGSRLFTVREDSPAIQWENITIQP